MLPEWLQIELAFIPVFMAGLGGLIWLMRMEGMVKQNSHGVEGNAIRLTRHIETDSNILRELREMNQRLSHLEGYMKARLERTGE